MNNHPLDLVRLLDRFTMIGVAKNSVTHKRSLDYFPFPVPFLSHENRTALQNFWPELAVRSAGGTRCCCRSSRSPGRETDRRASEIAMHSVHTICCGRRVTDDAIPHSSHDFQTFRRVMVSRGREGQGCSFRIQLSLRLPRNEDLKSEMSGPK